MPLQYVYWPTMKTDGMLTNIWLLMSITHSIADNNDEKTNVNGRCIDDVCLTHSSHRTRRVCQQKKKKEKENMIAQSCEKRKIDMTDNELREPQSRTSIRRHRLSILLAINIFYLTRT